MQDRSPPTRQIFLLRTAGPYIGSEADIGVSPRHVRFTPIADIGPQPRNVCFVPLGDKVRCSKRSLFDQFGDQQQVMGDFQTERSGRLEVDD